MTGIPYDEMPRYIEQYREEIENLTNSALQLNEIVKEKQKIIDKAIEYINEHSLYEQDYTYDYEENIEEWPPTDERARNDLLEILKGGEQSE